MKKGKRAAATPKGSKRERTIVREVRVKNLNALCGIDQEALFKLMALVDPLRHAELFGVFYNALLGFDFQVQAEMAEALVLYYIGEAHTVTGIQHVDTVLESLYSQIDSVWFNIKK